MAGPIAIDTPDYQRGIVNAQKQLATVPAPGSTVRVGIPPNAETLIVTSPQTATVPVVRCKGVTTGYDYTGGSTPYNAPLSPLPTYFVDVSSAVDSEVDISFSEASTITWYVYADSGVHVTIDASKAVNNRGAQYVVPVPPGADSGDYWQTELSYLGAYLNATGDVVAAPGAGQRLRVFAAQMGAQTAGVVGGLRNGGAGQWFATCGVSGDSHATFPLTGLPLPANQSINYQLVAGAGFMLITVAYTTETI